MQHPGVLHKRALSRGGEGGGSYVGLLAEVASGEGGGHRKYVVVVVQVGIKGVEDGDGAVLYLRKGGGGVGCDGVGCEAFSDSGSGSGN